MPVTGTRSTRARGLPQFPHEWYGSLSTAPWCLRGAWYGGRAPGNQSDITSAATERLTPPQAGDLTAFTQASAGAPVHAGAERSGDAKVSPAPGPPLLLRNAEIPRGDVQRSPSAVEPLFLFLCAAAERIPGIIGLRRGSPKAGAVPGPAQEIVCAGRPLSRHVLAFSHLACVLSPDLALHAHHRGEVLARELTSAPPLPGGPRPLCA